MPFGVNKPVIITAVHDFRNVYGGFFVRFFKVLSIKVEDIYLL